jgi:hypothetical protein
VLLPLWKSELNNRNGRRYFLHYRRVLENIIESTEGLIKRKKESISIDLEEYKKQLEKIQIFKENYSNCRFIEVIR